MKEKLQYNVWYDVHEHLPEDFVDLFNDYDEDHETMDVLCESEYKGMIYYDILSRFEKPTENEWGQSCWGCWEWSCDTNVTYWMAVKH